MSPTRRYKPLTIPRMFTFLIAVMLSSIAHAQLQFIHLGHLPGNLPDGIGSTAAYAVSADGSTVVGMGYGTNSTGELAYHTYRWTLVDGMTILDELSNAGGPSGGVNMALGISDNGDVIVGSSRSDLGTQAVRWETGLPAMGLGDLPGGDFYSKAYAVSGDGNVIVGMSHSTNGDEAFRWTAANGMIPLGALSNDFGISSSTARAASYDGSVIVGYSLSGSFGINEAFIWTQVGGMRGLGFLPNGISSTAYDVSADGTVVVGAADSGGSEEAFIWTEATGMVGLGTLRSTAYGVSADGKIVVGYYTSSDFGNRPFIWDEVNGMRDLHQMVETEYGVVPNFGVLTGATAISANGNTIVGSGYFGERDAWLINLTSGDPTADSDADGMPDGWEIINGLDPYDPADADLDNDSDGLNNLTEYQFGSNPQNYDTDNDILNDGDEYTHGTDPNNPDTDSDGMPDYWEVDFGLNPLDATDAAGDLDGDGLSNLLEYQYRLLPILADTDHDGLSDGEEVHIYNTDPSIRDSDKDKLSDGDEINTYFTDPLKPDTDADGLADGWEIQYGLNPLDNIDAGGDLDNDGFSNLEEFQFRTDPSDPNHYPGLPGTMKWLFTAAHNVTPPAIASDGTLYIGSQEHNVYAMNPDGSLKWTYTTGGEVTFSPSIAEDGTIYVLAGDNKIYALSPNGALKWTYPLVGARWRSFALASDGTVYVGSGLSLHAINPDGSLKWTTNIGIYGSSRPAIAADGTIYLKSTDDVLVAIDSNGTLLWTYRLSNIVGWALSAPTLAADGTIYVSANDYNLYAFNPDGSQKWVKAIGSRMTSAVVAADGTIYVSDGTLHAINPDGSSKWTNSTIPRVLAIATLGQNGVIYLQGTGSNNYGSAVYAINPDGTLKWTFESGDAVYLGYASNLGRDGTLYLGTDWSSTHDVGYLYALNTASGGLADSPWPSYKHDMQGSSNAGTVINQAPTLTITAPVDASLINEGDSISLQTNAHDAEDGDLSGTVHWTSSLDGSLGNGAALTATPSVGQHVISAQVTDSYGKTASHSITLQVNAAPQITILSPLAGTRFMRQDGVTLQGSATDTEDGDLSTAILWNSNIDGTLGTGASVFTQLSVGQHTVSATVTDSTGVSRADVTSVIIDEILFSAIMISKNKVELSWSGALTDVDIYQDGIKIDTGSSAGSKVYKIKEPHYFKVCEAATQYCSAEVSVTNRINRWSGWFNFMPLGLPQ